jgi:hypothetical protein
MLIGQLEMEFVAHAKSDELANGNAQPMDYLMDCAGPPEQPSLV